MRLLYFQRQKLISMKQQSSAKNKEIDNIQKQVQKTEIVTV